MLKVVNCNVWWQNVINNGEYSCVKFENFVYICKTFLEYFDNMEYGGGGGGLLSQ